MTSRAPFEMRLAASFSPAQWGESGAIVAFSAGPDSTALLAALAELRDRTGGAARLLAAHFNHRLRGADSKADEAHAVSLAKQLKIECVVGRAESAGAAAEQGDGIEAAAREERYAFLTDLAARRGMRYIATAHTLDDQAETVLHRIVRGTGIVGLGGIPRARALADGTIGLVRPLLGFRRADVLAYLNERGLEFRIDASNDDVAFTRNRLRHDLLPFLKRDYNPQIIEALARLAVQADELCDVVADLIEPLVAKSVRRAEATTCELDCMPLVAAPRFLVRAVLVAAWQRCGWPQQAMGFDEWNRLTDLALDPAPSTITLPGNIRAQKTGASLSLTRP